MKIAKYGRFWAVFDADGVLVCLTVYRKGAQDKPRHDLRSTSASLRRLAFLRQENL
jgi:hypothetical protein